MANYIDKEIICESYIHLNIPDDFTDEKIEEISKAVKKFFDERVKFFLGDDVITQMKVDEGSLKLTLTAIGTVATLLGGFVINYGSFRDGLKEIYMDSQLLAQATNLESVFLTKTPACDRLHSEARTGVIGRSAVLVTKMETLISNVNNIKAPSTYSEIKKIEETINSINNWSVDVVKLLSKIQSDEDRFCLAKGFNFAIKQLPKQMPAKLLLEEDSIKKLALKNSKLDLIASSAFTRYMAAVKSSIDNLKSIGISSKPKNA